MCTLFTLTTTFDRILATDSESYRTLLSEWVKWCYMLSCHKPKLCARVGFIHMLWTQSNWNRFQVHRFERERPTPRTTPPNICAHKPSNISFAINMFVCLPPFARARTHSRHTRSEYVSLIPTHKHMKMRTWQKVTPHQMSAIYLGRVRDKHSLKIAYIISER